MNTTLILLILSFVFSYSNTQFSVRVRPIIRSSGLHKLMQFTCSPGQMYIYGCTRCMCDPSTRREILCGQTECRRRYCTPLTVFKRGCYPCTCQLNGLPLCHVKNCVRKPRVKRRHRCKID